MEAPLVQPQSSSKWVKRVQQTLKDFRSNEIGKTGTRSSYKAIQLAQSNIEGNLGAY